MTVSRCLSRLNEEHQVALLHLVGLFLAVCYKLRGDYAFHGFKASVSQLEADELPRGKVSWE